jgi:spoIIIJ-associated protein
VQWVETTGRTIEDAKEAALDQLGIDESDAEFEVLEEPKTGLFGRPRGEARIRARVVPKAPRPKQERRPRKARGRRDGDSDASTTEAPAAAVATEDPAEGPSASKDERSGGGGGGSRNRRGGRGRGGEAGAKPKNDQQEGKHMTDEEVPVGEQADIITEFLEGLLQALGAEGTVRRTEVDEETIELSVEGDDLGLLIGPKGQTLTAVHELSRTVLQRRATGRHVGRVRIDIGGYRQRRQEALARFVRQQAEAVLAEGSSRALEPMNSADRKVVHDTINEIEGVATVSEGADPDRRVVIVVESAEA